MKAPRQAKLRSSLGAGIAVISLLIGGILITSLGFFSFEMIRHNTAHDELRSACEAAALAGAAAMASSDSTDPTVTHNNAIVAAQDTFRANTILGFFLTDANVAGMTGANQSTFVPDPNKSAMFIEFLDPNSSPPNQPVADLSSPNGRIVHVAAAFTNEPPLGKFFGLPAAAIRTSADGRVPSLDVVMCFDCSGSIDDQTPVTFVRRVWKNDRPLNLGSANDTGGGPGAIRYQVCAGRAGSPTPGGLAQGRIYDILLPAATGTSLEACAPQNLSISDDRGGDRPIFSTGMRGASNSSPPGNFPGGTAYGTANEYSDLVVNIDGNQVFGGFSFSSGGVSFDFPDVATLVEASRGNLEGAGGVYTSSQAERSLLSSVTPKPGYRAAYQQAALNRTQPIGAARDAAMAFFQIMHNNTAAHFGLVSFSTSTSVSPSQMHPAAPSVDSSYSAGGNTTLPFPGVEIDKNDNKLTNVLAAIPQTQAHGSTNMGGALQAAVNMMKKSAGKTRSGSKRAIIMFTDGQPTIGPSWSAAAGEAKADGICVYTVGLAQNSDIIPGECNNLNAAGGQAINYKDPITGTQQSYTPPADGMAAVAGNGGKFFLVTNTNDLRYVFENIARHLVQLVKQGATS